MLCCISLVTDVIRTNWKQGLLRIGTETFSQVGLYEVSEDNIPLATLRKEISIILRSPTITS